MDIGTVIGLIFGIVCIMGSMVLGGGNPLSLVNVPSMLVVFGGTGGALLMAYPLARLFSVHKVILNAVFTTPTDPKLIVRDIVGYAETARREGILALENMVDEMRDPFIVRGIKMAVDGTDPELIQTVMDTELEALMDRHTIGKKILENVARYAPAFGMIGTLMGLIAMLQNMDDPSKIGPGMAVALITTLYGAMIANVVCYPLADKLVARDAEEVLIKTIIIAGVMSIQSGDNPRIVEGKLLTYLPPSDRLAYEEAREAA